MTLMIKDEILSNLDNPAQLEKLYRADKPAFARSFKAIYPELKDVSLARFWNERLTFSSGEDFTWGKRKDLIFVIIVALLAGIVAKLPEIVPVNKEFFYTRNIPFILFPFLSAYFAWKNRLSQANIAIIAGATIVGLIFINALPDVRTSDSLILSCIHIALFLWSILGFAFVGEARNDEEKRLAFLKYNGDLIVMTTLIGIAGAIMSGITVGLFELIGFKIEEFYFRNIVLFMLPAAPILGTYLTQVNPHLVGRVSPVIAKIFSPLVLIMLVIYLTAMVYSGKDPYNDREFLLIFNALLVGVMAIILFSVAESPNATKGRAEIWVLLLLSVITVVVNGVALSAILFRISAGGFTPNRAAVLGGNILILVNLLMVTVQFFKVIFKHAGLGGVRNAITSYLAVYFIWTIIVTFLFPFIFWFR